MLSVVVQQLKPEVRASFVEVASQLFAQRGYAGASLRAVAAAADRSLGNVRNYFPSKDDLFEAACGEVITDVHVAIAGIDHRDLPGDFDSLVRLDAAAVAAVVSYIVEHREQLALLLEHSQGSRLSGWASELFETYVQLEQRRLEAFVKQHPRVLRRRPSAQIVRALCRMYFELAADFVRGKLDVDAFHRTVQEYDAFRVAGLAEYVRRRR